mmetsp:Transcript_42439/g.65118  ORF Transcript_42439/g.65118 Transcript_42439/m.65118 type:complete len:104 (+) Transcript_42439:2223-2534(+)
MINRGMDVKELANSQLFYPTIWSKFSTFSSSSETLMVSYDKTVDDLLSESPASLFSEGMLSQGQFEMQYKYLYLKEISGDDKQALMHTLKECQDIELFEQESI